MTLPDFLMQDSLGYIHLSGHRVGLRHVVELYRENYSPEMLHEHFPTVPLAHIFRVLAYYLENQAEVDAYIQTAQKAMDLLAQTPQPGPTAAELRQRMDRQQQRDSA